MIFNTLCDKEYSNPEKPCQQKRLPISQLGLMSIPANRDICNMRLPYLLLIGPGLLPFIGIVTLLLSKADSPSPAVEPATRSQWVFPGPEGKLTYKRLERGDRIMDFSFAGYMGGGVSLPTAPVKITLTPAAGDNTEAIQAAIDKVSVMPVVNGLRGAVVLGPGVYSCEKPLSMIASGVILRGSGSGKDGTIINMTGAPHTCIVVNGTPSIQPTGKPTTISDAYVPSGTRTFSVADPSGFAAGDTIQISRPVTAAWLAFMGMDRLVRDGKKQTWISGDISAGRVIQKIVKNSLTVDVPLTDSYDAGFTGPTGVTVQKFSIAQEPSQIGIEDLRILSPGQSGTIDETHNRALTINGITDGWARNLEIFNTVNSVSITAQRITLDNVSIVHDLPTTGAAKPADLNGSGPQLLFNRCRITGDNLFFFATGAKVTGPIVLLNCVFQGNGWIQPHQRWATGLLVDDCQVPGGGIDFMDRGAMGSGHGWAIGWSVAWNCQAKSYLNQQPPGAANWVIGCQGEPQKKAEPFNSLPLLPEGIYDSHGTPVAPASLYLAQLAERLGNQAVENAGY